MCVRARIAVYDQPGTAPRVVDVSPAPLDALFEDISSKIYELCKGEGTKVPYSVIREMVENFVHADFVEPVVSILDGGSTLRFADHGPGFSDKRRAVLPGFTTARAEMKRHIRGVGSGLPTVMDYLRLTGGSLEIDDNIGGGAVVTLHFAADSIPGVSAGTAEPGTMGPAESSLSSRSSEKSTVLPAPSQRGTPRVRLTSRQHQVLALVLETGSAGPSVVSKELGIGVSTAFRDLAVLEEAGLITSDSGRRTLTPAGSSFLDELLNHN
jgi:hypothetical protein